jgi:hypothetical protein
LCARVAFARAVPKLIAIRIIELPRKILDNFRLALRPDCTQP